MDSSENLGIQKPIGNDFTTEASPVTGSNPLGGPNVNFETDNNITHTDTYLIGKNLSAVSIKKRPSLSDFAEQIRQLEIEGNKLRTTTVSNLGYMNGFNFEANDIEMPKFQASNLGNLSALIDISADQKYISDLRMQLEKQSQETERLRKQLLGDMSVLHNSSTASHITNGLRTSSSFGHIVSNGDNSVFSHHSHSPEKPAFSTVASSELCQTFGRRLYDYEPPSHLERSLKESQEQVMGLRKKLQEVTEASELQKKQLYRTIEDLKSKLHDTILNRDTVLDLRQKEANSLELLNNKLQSSLTQLQEKYRLQEEVLASFSKKFESHDENNHATETALSQIRSILMDRENIRGHPYFETDPVSGQSIAILAHTLEKCLLELDHEINMKSCRISELESSVNEIKINSAERERAVAKEYQEKMKKEADDVAKMISQIHEEHEQIVANITEAATVARQQVTALQNKSQENETIMRAKDMEIKDLEDKIDELKTDNMKARALWQEKHQALESSLDQVQTELMEIKTEKNELIHSEAVLKSQLEDLQSLVSRYENDLETERDRVHQQRKREEDLRSQVMALEIEITNKQGDIDRLEKMLEVVKQECSATMFDKVASVEKLEKDRYLEQIKHLSTQLATMTDRNNKVTVEQQLARSEMDNLRSQVHDLTGKAEKARSQLEFALAEKHDLSVLLRDKHGDLDRLHRDKDHYMKMAEQKADEVTELRTSVDRLKTQLDEKEKILTTFRQQSNNISQLMEVNANVSESIREERDKLTFALTEKVSQVEDLKSSHDSLSKKVLVMEERIQGLEDERSKITGELGVKNQEIELLQQEKESILKELKESRMEVANLVSSSDVLKKEMMKIKTLRSKDINKLQTKLKESEQGYKLSQKALWSKGIVDQKAVKFADKIQKEMTVKRSEIDQLSSKLHRLEENLETVTKEKTLLERDKDNLKKALAKSLLHRQELSDELQKSESEKRELVLQVSKLEEELEQAALKASTVSAMVEKCEQEMETLKLKHQLDLKEAERLARSKSGSIVSYTTITGSSLLSTDSSGQQQNINSVDRKVDKAKPRDYSEVGKELTLLMTDMRNLISCHEEATHDTVNLSPDNEQQEPRMDKMKKTEDLNTCLPSPLNVQDLRTERKTGIKEQQIGADISKSWAAKSLSGLDLSNFSSYKEWRPRSTSLTRNHQPLSDDLEKSFSASSCSKGGYSDISRFSHSLSSPQKPANRTGSVTILLPDTQELCRRLEEKIDSLTRMGGNLVKENKEMAELINLQGEKLGTVKQNEKKAWEQR